MSVAHRIARAGAASTDPSDEKGASTIAVTGSSARFSARHARPLQSHCADAKNPHQHLVQKRNEVFYQSISRRLCARTSVVVCCSNA